MDTGFSKRRLRDNGQGYRPRRWLCSYSSLRCAFYLSLFCAILINNTKEYVQPQNINYIVRAPIPCAVSNKFYGFLHLERSLFTRSKIAPIDIFSRQKFMILNETEVSGFENFFFLLHWMRAALFDLSPRKRWKKWNIFHAICWLAWRLNTKSHVN